MWQFAEACRGLKDACASSASRSPAATSASTTRPATTAILPTPVVGGARGHRRRHPAHADRASGAPASGCCLLGETREELSGSEWAHVVHGHLGGLPPQVDLAPSARWPSCWSTPAATGCSTRAHDLSDGGLAQALVESLPAPGIGAGSTLPSDGDPFVALFAESAGRVLVTVPPDAEDDLIALCNESGVHRHRLGTVQDTEDAELRVADQFVVPLAEVRAAWQATIPEAMAVH